MPTQLTPERLAVQEYITAKKDLGSPYYESHVQLLVRLTHAYDALAAQLTAAQADNARLREALDRYGRHTSGCQSNETLFSVPEDLLCTCGWDTAQQALGEP